MRMVATLWLGLFLAASALLLPIEARAFCGFYVGGGTADLYNNATIVVLMRDGTRTVLSMQNNYEGPPEDFALVVPVPVVLSEETVKTLPMDIFDRVDQMAAPRLVEYWEQDPCRTDYYWDEPMMLDMMTGAEPDEGIEYEGHVVVEAEFTVGEYDIVILSADDSSALDAWLRAHEYRIPEGAEPALRPYIASGMKFFVAKVNTELVQFEDGQAMLSPLRFHYDTDRFELPIRLGLLNAAEAQDLIVHILAPDQRYETANYANVTIPTNLSVAESARDQFGAMYAALFDRTLERNPGAVVTEYAWDASSCDPCPGPTLTESDFLTLGADVLPSGRTWGFVLTRLHARYTSETLGEDLVFRAAGPIVGGREMMGEDGKLETGARPASMNNFQGRYIIRHPWTGPVECENPWYGRWGGPDGGDSPATPQAARDLAFAPRGTVELTSILREPVPELGIPASALSDPLPPPPEPEPAQPIALAAGFNTATQMGFSGGSIQAGTIGPECVGWIAAAPNHTFTVTGTVMAQVTVTSRADTTLVVRGPAGTFCNDDTQGLNPAVQATLTEGTYEVYVGNYGANAGRSPYTLQVTAVGE